MIFCLRYLKKILAMLKNIFFFLIILNSNLYSLTFKSDGSIIKSNGEVIKKSVAEEFQIQITKFQNNEDTDWTLANGSNISGYFGNKIFIKGVPLPKLPKINHFKVKDLALYNGFSSEDDFIIFILNNASKDWFERNKLNEKQIETRLSYPPLSKQKYLKKYSNNNLTYSERVYEKILWMPSSLNLTRKNIVSICSVINE